MYRSNKLVELIVEAGMKIGWTVCLYLYLGSRYISIHIDMSRDVPIHIDMSRDVSICPGMSRYVPGHIDTYRYVSISKVRQKSVTDIHTE